MKICSTIGELNEALKDRKGRVVGFVPTMGALHRGHISLVNESISNSDITVVSIFVNPTQFNNPEDLSKYPRDIEGDSRLLEAAGADIVFIPGVEDIYPGGVDYSGPIPRSAGSARHVDLNGLDSYGEGPRRPGHFEGVVEVVSRLFDIVKPQIAFFGEKDFQQLAIIKHFTKELGYKIEIKGCPTFREDDGLAMSSRNLLLEPQKRRAAPLIYKSLIEAAQIARSAPHPPITPPELADITTKKIDSSPELKTEYAEIINSLTLQPAESWDEEAITLCVAVYAGKVRLIDNIKLK